MTNPQALILVKQIQAVWHHEKTVVVVLRNAAKIQIEYDKVERAFDAYDEICNAIESGHDAVQV